MQQHNMCGVEGKRRLCDLNVTSSSPALATRHIDGRQPKTRISKFAIVQETKKKRIYSAMPRYIVLKLINYGNHIL